MDCIWWTSIPKSKPYLRAPRSTKEDANTKHGESEICNGKGEEMINVFTELYVFLLILLTYLRYQISFTKSYK